MGRYLANENVPRGALDAPRALGHAVAWVRLVAPGATDDAVLSIARAEQRVLLMFDLDFGELVFKRGRDGSPGVVLLRVSLANADDACERLARTIHAREDWAGHFSVVEDSRIRMIPLP